MGRRGLDADLVARGLVSSRHEALTLIDEKRVRVNGAIAENAARQVAPGDQLYIAAPPPRFVGRGAHKLEHALDFFAVEPAGKIVLDAGASTGGFTDSVLQRGASKVYAVDVGHGLLHEKLRQDERVINLERTNVRLLNRDLIPEKVGLVVGDLSFISLRLVIDPLLAVTAPGADMVLLVKPQFEAHRQETSRGGGVIRDDTIRQRIRAEIDEALHAAHAAVRGWTQSPITGASGNRELLVHAIAPGGVDP